jgi:predicted transcriptional regulator
MSETNKFEKEILTFKRDGIYNYITDEGGNLILNNSSNDFNKNYVAFSLDMFKYNNVSSFYNLNFEEYIPDSIVVENEDISNVKEELENEKFKNQELQSQLNEILEREDFGNNDSDSLAVKQVVLELRKALNQGNVDSDFSEEFPYTPIIKNIRNL